MAEFLDCLRLFFFMVFLLSTLLRAPLTEGNEMTAARAAEVGRHVIQTKSLFPAAAACTTAASGQHSQSTNSSARSVLEVVHRHSPCWAAKTTAAASDQIRRWQWSHQVLLDVDQRRVDALFHSRRHHPNPTPINGSLSSTIPDRSGLPLGTGNYVVTVAFGTPARKQTVVFDTGSDLSWIQCQPCSTSCYNQNDLIFDPVKSSTYTNISCSSQFCSQLDVSGCSGGNCIYGVQYGDSSFTVGFYAAETLTLTPSDIFTGFRFGCGEDNEGIFGQSDGLLGLGRQLTSLISQSTAKYGGVFSYCLPSSTALSGYLELGGSPPANVKYTPMLTDSSRPSFYFLSLVAINVGGVKLPIPTSVFSAAGAIVDSGTVITRLPPAAYSALRLLFRRLMARYPTAPAVSILDTCYDLSRYRTAVVPSVALVFSGGLTVELDTSGIVYAVRPTQVCLAFAGNNGTTDLAIIGNVQQHTFTVFYDIPNLKIGFAAGGCS